MANGADHNRLAARLDEIERRFEDRSARRDAENTEIREAIADIIARLGNLEGTGAETKTAISALQSVKPPGLIALAGPAIAAAVMVGALGVFVLKQAIEPVKESQNKTEAEMTRTIERQDNVRGRLAKLEGRTEEMDERIDDIDNTGSRKWIGSRPIVCKQEN